MFLPLQYQLPHPQHSDVSGAAVAFIILSFDEPMITSTGNFVENWALQRSDFQSLQVSM